MLQTREFCLTKPFGAGPQSFCPNCYCYCCDGPASDCAEWDSHCKATHTDPSWVAMRAAYKANGGKPPAAGAAASSSAAPSAASRPSRYVKRWSCDKILEAVQQVYPVEVAEPSGFASGHSLRPYQRQSLAFMIHNERSTDAGLEGQRGRLVQHVTSRPKHYGGPIVTWKPANKADAQPVATVRGGRLCDEVGMGKTAVVASLVLANPASFKPVSDDAFAKLLTSQGTPHKFPLTCIVVNNTIVRQCAGSQHELGASAPGGLAAYAPGPIASCAGGPTRSKSSRRPSACASTTPTAPTRSKGWRSCATSTSSSRRRT